MKGKAILVTFFAFFFNTILTVQSVAMDYKTLTYRESTGLIDEEISYVLTPKGDLMHINADFKDEYHQIVTDKNLNTMKLKIGFPESTAIITIHREADRLVIDDRQKRSIQVDPDIPWYQSLISLKTFALSSDKKRSFYSLSSHFDERLSEGKGIQLLRLVARKEAKESVEINGSDVETWKVMVTFDDLRSLFWKTYCWYRTSDGLLVQYREARGGPGTPVTVGMLIKEEHTDE